MHHRDTTIAVTGRYRRAGIRTYLGILRDIYGPALPAGLASWVDIGCGHGEFLAALRAFAGARFSITGLKPNVLKAAGCGSRGLDVVAVHKYPAASAIPWQVLQKSQLAIGSRRMPRLFAALRGWARERGRRVDMYIRARKTA